MKRSVIFSVAGFIAVWLLWYGFFGPTSHFTGNADKTNNAEVQLRNLPGLKGKKLNVFRSVSFYDDGRIYIQLQSPDTPQNINSYEYHLHGLRGEWIGPIPYKLDDIELPLSKSLYPLDSVSFADASKLVQIYNAKAKEVGSAEEQSMVEFTLITPHKWRWKYEDEITGGTDRKAVHYKIVFSRNASVIYFGPPNQWNDMNNPGNFSYARQLLNNLPNLKGKKLLFDDNVQFDDPGHVYINLQDPEHPEKILSYIYFQGEWEEDTDFEKEFAGKRRHWYPLDKVSFDAATKIATTYTAKIKEAGSDQPALDTLALDITGKQPAWKFKDTIKGKNGTYIISFNTDGSLKRFARQ